MAAADMSRPARTKRSGTLVQTSNRDAIVTQLTLTRCLMIRRRWPPCRGPAPGCSDARSPLPSPPPVSSIDRASHELTSAPRQILRPPLHPRLLHHLPARPAPPPPSSPSPT